MNEKKLLIDLLNKRKKSKNKKQIKFGLNLGINSLSIRNNDLSSSNNNQQKINQAKKNTCKTVANSSSKENEQTLNKKSNLLIE